MKVYQRLARRFAAEGVSHVFGIMGDGNMYWMHELDKLGAARCSKCATRAPGSAWRTAGRASRTPRASPPQPAARA